MLNEWAARHPRFHVHFAPTGSSWLNQVERWFGCLTDQLTRRGVHNPSGVYGHGRPLTLVLTAGNINDCAMFTRVPALRLRPITPAFSIGEAPAGTRRCCGPAPWVPPLSSGRSVKCSPTSNMREGLIRTGRWRG
ncbi:hypothetical protein [Nocardia rhamnosiphila]